MYAALHSPVLRFMTRLLPVSLLCLVLLAPSLSAHEVRPAYLELTQTGAETYEVLWKVPARGEDQRLALYVEFPPGTAYATPPHGSLMNHAFTSAGPSSAKAGWPEVSSTSPGLRQP